MNINFTDKELQVIELMAPGKTAEEIINIVLRDWFNSNADRMYKQIKPQVEVLDEIIAVETAKKVAADNAQPATEEVVK